MSAAVSPIEPKVGPVISEPLTQESLVEKAYRVRNANDGLIMGLISVPLFAASTWALSKMVPFALSAPAHVSQNVVPFALLAGFAAVTSLAVAGSSFKAMYDKYKLEKEMSQRMNSQTGDLTEMTAEDKQVPHVQAILKDGAGPIQKTYVVENSYGNSIRQESYPQVDPRLLKLHFSEAREKMDPKTLVALYATQYADVAPQSDIVEALQSVLPAESFMELSEQDIKFKSLKFQRAVIKEFSHNDIKTCIQSAQEVLSEGAFGPPKISFTSYPPKPAEGMKQTSEEPTVSSPSPRGLQPKSKEEMAARLSEWREERATKDPEPTINRGPSL